MPRPLPDALVELMSRRLRALGQPIRIRLLAELATGSYTVQELSEAMATTQQNVSKHLGVLYQTGLVCRQPVGAQVVYSAAGDGGLHVLELTAADVARHARELGAIASGLAGGTPIDV